MKIKKSAFCLLGVAALALPVIASCGTSSVASTTSSVNGGGSSSAVVDGHTIDDLSTAQTLNLNCFYNSTSTMMTFPEGTNYTGANGKTYGAGDFKPVWEAVQQKLNFTIVDKTDTAKTSVADQFSELQTNGFKSADGELVNIAQGNSKDIIAEGTKNGTILDLSKYLDAMPNFNKYLSANPVVKKQIVDSNGAIFYAPYFDGADDMEKTLLMRAGWVATLLDGDYDAAKFDTGVTISTAYTRYNAEVVDQDLDVLSADGKTTEKIHKKYTAGNDIITLQNGLAAKTGAALVKALRDYIDTTYAGAYGTTRSALFIGGKACYNIDELVALYRCVKACPQLLTGDASKVIVPLMPREMTNDRTSDLWNFMLYFGCRGFNSRQTYYYIDDNGLVADIRTSSTFTAAMEEMHNMYTEGLILKDFTSKTAAGVGDGKYENGLFKKTTDGVAYSNTGFSEYDYVQTQTILNNSNSDLKLVPVYPAAYAWKDGTESRFTESWRSVKSQGWFITADTAKDVGKLRRSLYLFDYFWGTEGSKLMSYGPDAWIDGTTSYMGREIPKLSAACLKELTDLTKGNYTNYYRQYLGGTFPIGYVKEQGMEYQTVNDFARTYLDTVETALDKNVIAHPSFTTGNTDHFKDIMPTTLSYTSGEQSAITANYSGIGTYFSTDKGKTNILTTFCQNGFVDATNNISNAATYLSYVRSTLKLDAYDALVQRAYDRMGLQEA
jgi:hypothetical protein